MGDGGSGETVDASGGGFWGDLVAMLQELVVDEVTIESILSSLTTAEDTMPTRKQLRKLGVSDFGTLPAGSELANHTTNADEFVVDSMLEMLHTLGVYVDGVKTFKQGANIADEYTAAQLQRINQTIQSGQTFNDRPIDETAGTS